MVTKLELPIISPVDAAGSPQPPDWFTLIVWPAIVSAVFFVLACSTRADDTTERVRVSAAKVLSGIESQPALPDKPPEVTLKLRASSPAATGVCPEEASVLISIASPEKAASGVYVRFAGVPLLLTASHVLAGVPDSAVVMAGESVAHRVLIDEPSDISVLYTGEHAAVDLAESPPVIGDLVETWGRAANAAMANQSDVVTGIKDSGGYLNNPYVECREFPPLGRSGGGLFRNGCLVGILHARDLTQPRGMYSRLEVLQMILSRVNLTGKRLATVYTGEAVYGDGWCRNCGPFKKKLGDGTPDLLLTYSRLAAPGPVQSYPAVRFIDVSGRERYPAMPTPGGVEYKVVEDHAELIGFIDRNRPGYVIPANPPVAP